MNVLFFAFANDPKNPLPNLQKEADEIRRLLSRGELEGHYLIKLDPYATREKISYYLSLYKDHITHFHYSGHAGQDVLLTEKETTHADGIAQLLGQCPKLNCVFLNGCATDGQVEGLWKNGIGSVIATQSSVSDVTAAQFSIRFYQALAVHNDLQTAFELAKGDALTQDPRLHISMSRGFSLDDIIREGLAESSFRWKLYIAERKEEILTWKLPEHTALDLPTDFVPNTVLIETLIQALRPYSREIRSLFLDEEEEVDIADKRLAILNSLPAPIAEQLRKLMVPFSEKDKGYDKISRSRVEQLVKTSSTLIELFTYTLLAQLWEALEKKESLVIRDRQLSLLKSFLHTSGKEREFYDFLPLLQSLGDLLENNGIEYFIEELSQLKQSYQNQSSFVFACHYLNTLRYRIQSGILAESEIVNACIQGENQLATIFQELGFLANYIMAAIRKIDVVKYRHIRTARFSHSLVRLVKVMGGLELKEEELDEFMDNRSVLLLKKKIKGNTGKLYMNLSPFVIDQNAFDERPTDISKVYFFFSFDPVERRYSFRHVDKPEDLPLVLPKENYEIVSEQFDAFAQLIFNRPMAAI